jgi:predicted  nucleic acid-binding Zn-ribbon protein
LREVAELDRRAAKLKHAAATRAKDLAADEAAVTSLRTELAGFTQQLNVLQARLHAREVELKTIEQSIARNEEQKLMLKSKADLDRMDGQIASRRIEASAIESSILESMELVERVDKELAQRRNVLEGREARLALKRQKGAEEAADAAKEEGAMPGLRAAASVRVSAEVLAAYESARRAAGDFGLSSLSADGFCADCGTRLSPQLQASARVGKLPPCPGCSRLLAAS